MPANLYILPPGTKIQGPERTYTIVRELGHGGFGVTYLASANVKVGNIIIAANFALKEHFISSLCSRDGSTQRIEYSAPVAEQVKNSLSSFIKEARRLQGLGLTHPNIVKINEVFEANNTAYYVMEYLGGTTLQQYVEHNGPMSAAEVRELMLPLIEAVAALHTENVAHYDIKPQNIMLHEDGEGYYRAVLIDFGLAKHYDRTGAATSTVGTPSYTPGYAPVEQYIGLSTFSPASDVYALSATLYFLLTGITPPPATRMRLDEVHQNLAQIQVQDPALVNAILNGMAMLDIDRTPDAAALLADIKNETSAPSHAPKTVIAPAPVTPASSSAPETIISQPAASAPETVISQEPVHTPTAEELYYDDDEEDEKKFPWKYIGIAAVLVGLILIFVFYPTGGDNAEPVADEMIVVDSVIVNEAVEAPNLGTKDVALNQDKSKEKETVKETIIVPEMKNSSDKVDKAKDDSDKGLLVAKTSGKEDTSKPMESKSYENEDEIYVNVEERAQFPGGEAALYKYLANNIRYPEIARQNDIQGRVVVQFVVSKSGDIGSVKVVRGKDHDLDREAIRVVKSMPKFIPAKVDGKPVSSWYTLPVNFKLQ